ncbi:hypothetical protein AWB80_04424 [Caballeronia pedi]|uniref:Uncharacterized protein n=1 Tax=Caballeronia pedi TaxID=1777141 RepID=A0A158C1F6_9BURK|nr:hypothetical protein [Caballeronia pedi]SAK76081.1 hypothetical protein AWB80_04424 [Caballeronia pedi]
MKLKIENQGDTDVRVIVDRDTVNDSALEPGERSLESETERIVELRAFHEEQESRLASSETPTRSEIFFLSIFDKFRL